MTDPELLSHLIGHYGLFFVGYDDWCGPASATLIGVGGAARATADTSAGLLAQATHEGRAR